MKVGGKGGGDTKFERVPVVSDCAVPSHWKPAPVKSRLGDGSRRFSISRLAVWPRHCLCRFSHSIYKYNVTFSSFFYSLFISFWLLVCILCLRSSRTGGFRATAELKRPCWRQRRSSFRSRVFFCMYSNFMSFPIFGASSGSTGTTITFRSSSLCGR